LQRLRPLATDPALGDDLRRQVELVLTRGTNYAASGENFGKKGSEMIARLDSLSRQLETSLHTHRSSLGNWLEKSGWSKELFRPRAGTRPNHTGNRANGLGADWAATVAGFARALREINTFLAEALHTRDESGSAENRQMEDRLRAFEDSAQRLADKKYDLPGPLGVYLEGIASTTFAMTRCMREDERDRESGQKFLTRYLDAAHKVVDEHIRLSGEGKSHQDVAAALGRAGDVLARLEKAFRAEQASMLQNDAVTYTAELNALDAMLKMRGH